MHTHKPTPQYKEIETQFYLPPRFLSLLDKHFLLLAGTRDISSRISKNAGYLSQYGVLYLPVFRAPHTSGILSSPSPDSLQVKLSFRRIKGEDTGYVIISPCARKNQESKAPSK